ncbi:MAG: glycerophosphodiester phosphodiesterase family protein [Oceanicaulis sp.]
MIRTALALSASLAVLAACDTAPAPSAPDASMPASTDAWFAGVDLSAYLDCAREQGVTLLQAHRAGDRAGAAENSLAAIEASLADGAVFLEIDVARTADGVLVLMHDDTIDRTTTGTGEIEEITYAELLQFELVDLNGAPTGERVPTLAETLAFLDGRGVAQIDLKDIGFDAVAATLTEAGAADRAVVITYSSEDAIAFDRYDTGAMISAGMRSVDDLDALLAAGVEAELLTAWLGLGTGNPELDAALAARGIETSYGDFRAERQGEADYRLMAENGAEVISVDDVPAASAALDAAATARSVLEACPAARG